MNANKIKSAVADITAEQDPTVKSAKLASLCSALWAERGVQLVVVGGSAIEILTEGAYASGDLDMCHVNKASLPLRERQEVMGLLGAKGGPRNWQVAGTYFDLLGPAESFAHTPFRRVEGPYGPFLVMIPEDLLVERVLVSYYPERNSEALECARKFIAVILTGGIALAWGEVRGLRTCRNTVTFQSVKSWSKKSVMSLGSKVPCIPIEGSISWQDWLKGRRFRREMGNLVAPAVIRRKSSSKDRRLKKLFKGQRGLPFTPIEKL